MLFIDEIHRLQKTIEEYLYPAMEDFKLDIIIDQGPNARSVRLNLPHFTLIGATTRSGLLTAPLLTRFPVRERLDYYQADQLQQIVIRSARLLNIEIEESGAREIARRSRGTPRIANNLLRRVRDYAQVRGDGRITSALADKALAILEIDENGLDEMDKRILDAVISKFGGGPVGLGSLAVAVGEEPDTLEEVYEPYLIMEGYLKRTPQGRVATELSYKKLGLKAVSGHQPVCFSLLRDLWPIQSIRSCSDEFACRITRNGRLIRLICSVFGHGADGSGPHAKLLFQRSLQSAGPRADQRASVSHPLESRIFARPYSSSSLARSFSLDGPREEHP